jgi:DNA polymerase epsilon subunit 1
MGADVEADFEFPVLPGSHLHFADPTLEFIKSICSVFCLAQEYQVEIGLLKRNLLELISVKEFASEATFRNPCEPLKLSNVPCRYCDGLRDFDFCRDPDLTPNNTELNQRWLCSSCGGEYDRLVIEMTLIDMLHSLERSFTQQDLKCSKCKQVRSDNVSRYCQCSGQYQLTTNKVDLRRKLRTVVNVAIVHNLGRLKVSGRTISVFEPTLREPSPGMCPDHAPARVMPSSSIAHLPFLSRFQLPRLCTTLHKADIKAKHTLM